ncbi:unnamed protein product [Ectocarpus sp. CCAP 1310/34]|nr:unnamed protein product [Ectocarpus sp. CCAP 1310/34]
MWSRTSRPAGFPSAAVPLPPLPLPLTHRPTSASSPCLHPPSSRRSTPWDLTWSPCRVWAPGCP